MNHLIITGVPPYDGRYEFDMERDFTTREWGWLKRLAGYLPLNIEEGFDGGQCHGGVLGLVRAVQR